MHRDGSPSPHFISVGHAQLELSAGVAQKNENETLYNAVFLAELFRGMLFKWKGENKKSHQK